MATGLSALAAAPPVDVDMLRRQGDAEAQKEALKKEKETQQLVRSVCLGHFSFRF